MSWIPLAVASLAREHILDASKDEFSVDTPHGNNTHTHASLVNTTEMGRAAAALQQAFPAQPHGGSVLHAFAAKANPLTGVLRAAKQHGLGCEVASIGELVQALKVFPASSIVYDSPVKTVAELRFALRQQGLFLNVDNFQELERVAAIYTDNPANVAATVGIRINPQVGAGTIGQCSTGLATSKFGIGLNDARTQIIEAFKKYPFLRMLHVHTGSQGCGLVLMAAGVHAITRLAEEINQGTAAHGGKCDYIDIGGGLPVNFSSDEITPTFEEYAALLREKVPALFSGRYGLITEFGRALVAKAGFLASRVEYAKENGGRRIIQQHIGADLAIRTVWQPDNWKLRVQLFDGESGAPLPEEDLAETDVAGPCCLGGDLIAIKAMLPPARPLRDIVVAKDVGGYFHSAYSYYNLRSAPPCYLFCEETGELQKIQDGHSTSETLSLFS